ncbi:hypothetical protein KMZ93_22560 [Bradyrhizobium sediminis]|uniref:Uncharacterized protein n=1 Tax=Bradyrhizobium sediminis TaxID=2840469 RepID=A0A975RWV9_9BRAD|nr:hypothetical protein [Bradyrhizobium sediminis]QWG22709.1 hypothetical protein KMZ93_22560 [Bradyrhizobium sediminis]
MCRLFRRYGHFMKCCRRVLHSDNNFLLRVSAEVHWNPGWPPQNHGLLCRSKGRRIGGTRGRVAGPGQKRPQQMLRPLQRDLRFGCYSIRVSSSPPEDCPHDGAGLGAAGLGDAQLGAGAGAAMGSGAAGFAAAGLGAAGLGAAGLAAAFFLAGLFLALAFLADFFAAFLADFFGADFLAVFLAVFFADFLAFFADFFEDFLADFFFAVTALFLAFFAFLPFLLFLPLAIVNLLLPPNNVHQAFQVVRFRTGPIDQLNPGRGPPVAQSRSSIVCTTGTDVPPAI